MSSRTTTTLTLTCVIDALTTLLELGKNVKVSELGEKGLHKQSICVVMYSLHLLHTTSMHSLISECILSLPLECGMSLHKVCPSGNTNWKGKDRSENPIMSCPLWRRSKQLWDMTSSDASE